MNINISFSKGIRIVAVLAGLALTAYGGQAALAKPADRVQPVQPSAVVQTSGGALLAKDISGQAAESNLVAADRSGAKSEPQPADDKGGLNAGQAGIGVELGDDKGAGQAELGDDRGLAEPELADDKGNGELQPGDDRGVGEAEDASRQSAGQVELRGVLTAINGNVLTLNGMTLTLSATTEITGTLKVGDMVKVEGFRLADNTIQIREIKIGSQTASDDGSAQPSSTSTDDRHGGSMGGASNSGSQVSDNPASDNHGGNPGSDDPKGHH